MPCPRRIKLTCIVGVDYKTGCGVRKIDLRCPRRSIARTRWPQSHLAVHLSVAPVSVMLAASARPDELYGSLDAPELNMSGKTMVSDDVACQ